MTVDPAALTAARTALDAAAASIEAARAALTPKATTYFQGTFWTEDIRTAPLDANSAALATEFDAQRRRYYNGDVSINTLAYAAPVWIAPPDAPRIAVGFADIQGKGWREDGLLSQLASVPWPVSAVPADGTDAELAILQPSTGEYYELWVTKVFPAGRAPGIYDGVRYYANPAAPTAKPTVYCAWGGKIANLASSTGAFPNHYGTTATSLPFLGGQISLAEAQAAITNPATAIPHALGVAPVEVKAGSHSWPATRNDGWITNNPLVIEEGRRLRLDPALNVAALNIHPLAKAVAYAVQRHGFVVWDKAGAMTLRGENPKPLVVTGKPDPWPTIFAPKAGYNVMAGFPWTSLQVLPHDYGKF